MSNETPAEVLADIDLPMQIEQQPLAWLLLGKPGAEGTRWIRVATEKSHADAHIAIGLEAIPMIPETEVADRLERSLAAGKVSPVAWMLRDSRSKEIWLDEVCVWTNLAEAQDCADDMNANIETASFEVFALYTAPPADPGKASDVQDVRWMDEACRLLDEAGHGIHAAALGTLAHAIRIGRVADVGKASGSAPGEGCAVCFADCAGANPPVMNCPMRGAEAPATPPASAPEVMALARGAWRAGITLGNNICVQESDRENDQDGDSGWINGTAECAKRIREWADPEDEQLIELLNEAGVDTTALQQQEGKSHG